MKKSTILLITTLLFHIAGQSQVFKSSNKNSYFMGKRGLIEVGLNPIYSRVYYAYQSYYDRLNIGPWAEYTFALTNNLSTTLHFGQNRYYRQPIHWFSELDEFYQAYFISEMVEIKEINTNRLGIRINKALMKKKGAIAPMGHYVGIGCHLHMNSVEYSDNPLVKYHEQPIYYGLAIIRDAYATLAEPIRFNTWSLDLFYGARINVTKSFFMSWSASTALSSFRTLLDPSVNESTYHNSNDAKKDFSDIAPEDLVGISKYTMQTRNFFNFRLGIGMIIH